MAVFLRILLGLGIVVAGVVMVIKTGIIIEFVGPIPWAENTFGTGGTNLFYKLLGILIILIGFVVTTNLWDALLGATLGQLFNR